MGRARHKSKRRTFRDLFMDYLETCIQEEDDLRTLIGFVNAYQMGHPSARSAAFSKWIEDESFRCEKCGREFVADADTTEEEHVVLCEGCAPQRRGGDAARGRK